MSPAAKRPGGAKAAPGKAGGKRSAPSGSAGAPPEGEPDLVGEVVRQLMEVGSQVKEALDKLAHEAEPMWKSGKEAAAEAAEKVQYKVDQELARALAKHPDLYAEIRKTFRQVNKTLDKAAESLGLKK